MKALIEGQRPILFGDGSATRDFCFVDNVCAAIHSVADRQLSGRERVFNIGTGIATSLEQLYTVLCNELAARGVKLPPEGPERRPWRPGDLLHSCADIGLARDRLDYIAGIDLKDGLRRLISEEYRT
jgi:nucleoside-diphosphate-sugar epimerase